MKIKVPAILLTLLISFSSIFTGCKKDFDTDKIKAYNWTPEFAVPLVNDSITFEKALIETGTEKNFFIDESGDVSLLLYYKNNAFRISPNDLLKIPPSSFQYQHSITSVEHQVISSQDYQVPPVLYTFNLSQGNPGVRVNNLLIKKGILVIHSTNTFDNDGYLNFSFSNATKNGIPFGTRIGPFQKGQVSDTIDLSGVIFNLSSNPNLVGLTISGLLKKSSKPVAGDQILSNFTLSILEIGWFEGYLGQLTFSPPEESVKITVFNNAYNVGDIYFVDPKADITLHNSIGIPAQVTLQKLEARNTSSGNSLDIAARLGTNAIISIPSPSITNKTPTVTTREYSNSNTGNSINDLFNQKPDYVDYKIKTDINPAGQSLNFFADTSSFYADLSVKLPLFGRFSNITVKDTFSFTINDLKEIDSLALRTYIRNGLPLDVRLQVYFTDNNFHILDSLTGSDKILIKEAPVDPSTYLPYPGQYGVKDTTFLLGKSRIEKITGAKKILVKGVLNSSGNGVTNVKIKSNQSLKLVFTGRVKINSSIKP
ncbi:MAG: hypothetical protein Q8867_06365 [Bacteroidota bacterium]|nr:hypothetical protein [Bacteroidota bacterium]